MSDDEVPIMFVSVAVGAILWIPVAPGRGSWTVGCQAKSRAGPRAC